MKILFRFLAGMALLAMFPSCKVDEQYSNIRLEDIDTEMTLFQNGIDVPMGSMTAVTVKEIVGLDDSVKEFLTADEDGNYSIRYNGTFSLNDQLDEALGQVPSVDGVKFSSDMNFSLGNFDLDQLSIKGLSFDCPMTFGPFDNPEISVPEVSATSNPVEFTLTHFEGIPSELLTLGVDYTIPGSFDLGEYEIIKGEGGAFSLSGDLPEELASVDKLYFSEATPFVVEVKTDKLGGITTNDGKGKLEIAYSLTIEFPEGVDVDKHDAGVPGRVTFEGKLKDGTLKHLIWVKSIVPQNNAAGHISFSGDIDATLTARASGSFNLAKLQATPVKVEVSVSGKPALSDFDITLNQEKMKGYLSVDEKEDLNFVLDGFDDFGTFDLVPSGSPKAQLVLTLPTLGNGLALLGDGLKIKLPDMMILDGSAVSGFDSATNTVTVNGPLPSMLEIPIAGLHITPQQNAQGSLEFNDRMSVTGNLKLSGYSISKTTLDNLNGAEAKLVGIIPDIQTSSISLAGDYSRNVEETMQDVVILGKDALESVPEQVKYIQSLEFAKGTRLMVKIVPSGLPVLSGSPFTLKDAVVTLPEALKVNGSNVIKIADQQVKNNTPITVNLDLDRLEDIDLANISEIRGDIAFKGCLHATKPDVDVSTLSHEVGAKLEVGIGNGSSAAAPGELEIDRILGKVEYDIHETFAVEFPELPEVLTAEDVVLELEPQLMLDMKSNLGLPVKGNIQIVPYRNGVADMENAVNLNDFTIPYSESSASESRLSYAIGTGLAPQNGIETRNVNLGNLVRRIPDSLQVRLDASVDRNRLCVVEPKADYVCDLDYGMKVPLKFGKNTKLSLSFDDLYLGEEIGEILKKANVGFRAVASSTIPAGIRLTLQLVDAEGAPVDAGEMEFVLNASESGQVSRSELKPLLSLHDTARTPVAIRIKASVFSAENGNCLNEEDYLGLEDVVITLPKGITYDPLKGVIK